MFGVFRFMAKSGTTRNFHWNSDANRKYTHVYIYIYTCTRMSALPTIHLWKLPHNLLNFRYIWKPSCCSSLFSPPLNGEDYVYISVGLSGSRAGGLAGWLFPGSVWHGRGNILKHFGVNCFTPDQTVSHCSVDFCALGVLLVNFANPRFR